MGLHTKQWSINCSNKNSTLNFSGDIMLLFLPHAAGPYGLSGCGPGPAHHLSHLSYEGREFLAENLNGNPPERNVFHSFCHALGVDNRLARVSARSPNPTAYLIQEYSAKPEATFDRLEQALAQIGKRDVFEGLWMRMQSGY